MSQPTVDDHATARLRELGVRIEKLRETDQWAAYLKAARQFHNYSTTNQIMIWFQRPDASRVAGYKRWQELGRQVRRGERGITILAPVTRKDEETGLPKLVAFKQLRVFDISQTDGEPLPALEWPQADYCPKGMFEHLSHETVAELDLQITVARGQTDEFSSGARGWYDRANREIVIVDQGSEAANVQVLLHELGHHYADHQDDEDRPARELLAESTAYLAAGVLGVGMEAETEHYLATWQAQPDQLVAIAKRANAGANKIIDLMGPRVIGREEAVA